MSLGTSLISGVAGAAIGAFATVATGAFGYLNKDRELDIRMVDIALSILSGDNKGVDAEPGRRFALRLLQTYSQTNIPPEEFDVWVSRGTLELSALTPVLLDEKRRLSESAGELDQRARDLRFSLGRLSTGVDGLAGRSPQYHEIREQVLEVLKQSTELQKRMDAVDELIKAAGAPPTSE
jgi:hypothetical protein